MASAGSVWGRESHTVDTLRWSHTCHVWHQGRSEERTETIYQGRRRAAMVPRTAAKLPPTTVSASAITSSESVEARATTRRAPMVRGACSNPPGTDGFLGLMT